jgi:hypothetical protein
MNRKAGNVALAYLPKVIIFIVALGIIIFILWLRYGGMTVDSALDQLAEIGKMLMIN